MKPKPFVRALLAGSSLLAFSYSHAATLYWDGTSASWNDTTNWSTASSATTPDPAAVPGASDDAIFNITTANGAETITLDANQAAKSLTFNNTGTTTLTGGGTARTLTLGTGGLTLASGAGAVTLGDGTAGNDVLISLSQGSRSLTNNSANNLTISNTAATISRSAGATLTFNQASTGIFSMSTTVLPNDATGIVGPWALYGTGTSQRYAFNNSGTLAGYSAGTAAADANAFASATTNYDLTSAAVTLSASRTANTFRSAGAGGAISLGASGTNSLTLNGILAVGSGTLTIQDSGSTGTVAVGSSNELVIAGPQNVTIDTQITAGAGKSLTYAGTGTLQISGTNGSSAATFTGNLNVNSGTFTNVTTQTLTNSIDVTTFVAAGATYNWQGAFGAGLSATKPWTVNGTLTKTGNGDTTFSAAAPISGTGTISLSGQANVTLNGNNSGFTGTFNEGQAAGTALTLGHNGALGAGTFNFSGTLPVQSTVTNFTNSNVTALTFSNDRIFQGSNNMNLGAGAVTLSGANRTLTVTGITLTLGGAIGQDVAGRQLTKAGTGTLVLSGTASTYSGATVINAGNLDLGGSTANGSLASPTLTLGGGTFSYTRTGTNTQSFTTTNFNSAPANVLSVASGNTLNLGSIVRGAGVSYDFSTAGAGTVAANLSNNSAAGIMSPYFTYGANNWAVANGPGVAISAYTGYTQTSGGGTTANNYTGANIDVDNSAGALDAGITTNSVRFNSAAANTLSLTGANVISSGGILVGSGAGANLSTITGGTLTGAASSALTIWQNNTQGGLTISSNIINNTATTLDKFGPGLLTLSGTNTYTGTTTIYGGTLAVSGGAAIANTGLVTLANTAGVTFRLDSNETIGNLSGGGTTGGTVALQGNTLTLGDGTAQTYSGNFTGTSGSNIIKQGTAALTLANATSIPGTMSINAGTAQFSIGNLSGGTITLNGSPASIATLDMRFSSAVVAVKGASGLGGAVISNPIVLGSSVTTTGARLYTSTGDGSWTFTGGITGAAGATQTLVMDTRSGGTTGGDRATTTISGVIANGSSGTLGLSFNITPQTSATASNNHPTYVNLTGANTFTGNITAIRGNAGATSWLTIGGEHWANGSFGANTPTYGRMGSGRLGDNNSGVYAGAINLGSTAGQIVNLAYFSSANQTWSGVVGGGSNPHGALVKEGTGTLTLTNANLYNRLTTIGGGTLLLGFDTTTSNILPSTTPLNMGLGTTYNSDSTASNASLTMTTGPSGGTLQLAGAAASATQTVASLTTAANTANTILVGANRTLTITSGTVTTGASSSLNFNTAAGNADASTSTVGTSIVAFSAAPTGFTNGFTVTDSTGFGLAKVNGSNQVIRDTTTALLPASLAGSTTDYRIDNNGGGSGAAGSSTLAITASQSAKSITVDTTGGSGVLTLNSGVTLSNNIWNFGGTNNYQITGGTGIKPVATGNSFVINNYCTGTVTFTSPLLAFDATANPLVVNGTGTTVLGGANTFTGAITISGGTLRVTGNLVAAYNAAIAIAPGATLQYSSGTNLTLGTVANITGGGGLTLDGGKDLTLQGGTSTWSGSTLITGNNSRLIVGNAAGALSPATNVTVVGNGSGGGQLYLNIAGTYPQSLTISGVGFAEADAQSNFIGAIRTINNDILSGTITLAGNSRIGSFGATTTTISGRITGGYGIDFWGMVSANTQVPTFILSNTNNNYTGNTTIYASQFGTNNPTGTGTTLKLGASNVIPDGASAGNVVFALNGTNSGGSTVTLDLNGFSETINGLTVNSGTFTKRITNSATGASVLTVGANDTSSSFSGTITDAGTGKTLALTKTGTGTLTLSGANTYIGATTVSQGTLELTGGSTTSAISVSSGASLGFTLGTSITSSSSVNLTSGTVKITGTPTLSSYTLITATGGITGTPTLDSPIAGYALQVVGNQLQLNSVGDTTPPTLSSIADDKSGGPVDISTLVTYTVTFSEDMDASTVSAADFGNAGTASVTIGTVTETSPGVFSVQATPTNSGTLILKINAGAELKDVAGNNLVTTSALPDDTTITVRTPYATWANGYLPADVSNPAGNNDGDTLTNLQEYAFGTDPTVSSTGPITWSGATVTSRGTPVIIEESGNYYAVYGRRVDYVSAGLTYTQQFSADLTSAWYTDSTAPTVIATDGVIDAVKVALPGLIPTDSGPQKARFFQVGVSQ